MRTIDVTDFGEVGTADDTETVQGALAASREGDALFFPPGVYTLNDLNCYGQHKRTFYGAGIESVLKQYPGSNWMTIHESDDIHFHDLLLDANGVDATFGGIRMYGCRGPTVERMIGYDSNPQPPGQNDRYAFTFSVGARPTERLHFAENLFSYLQCEFDFIKNSSIVRNRIAHSVNTAGIGLFSQGEGIASENVNIIENWLIEGRGASICVLVDPPSNRSVMYKNIAILGNKIYRIKQDGQAIRIGTGNVTVKSAHNQFERFEICDNEIEYFEQAAAPDAALIWLITGKESGFVFKDFSIKRNRLKAQSSLANCGMNIRKLENSEVCDNEFENLAACMAFGDRPKGNLVTGNIMRPAIDLGWGLVFEDSAGGNRVLNNLVTGGNPLYRYHITEPNSTDLIIQ